MRTNMNPDVVRTTLVGHQINKQSPPPVNPKTQGILFESAEGRDPFQLSLDHLSKGLLLLGGTGSGKSNIYKLMLRDILPKLGQNDLLFCFDPKGEFLDEISRYGRSDVVIISTVPQDRDITAHWNVFEELLASGDAQEMELQAREIARGLFAEHIDSSQQPFFGIASSDVFAAVLLDHIRSAKATSDYSKLNNRQLVHFFKHATADTFIELIERNPDFSYMASYIGKKGPMSPQALGVLGVLNSVTNSILFGPFAAAGRPFSMARLTRERKNPNGKIVVLKFDLRHAKILETVYSLFITQFIKQTLSLGESNFKTFMFLDELALLPHIQELDMVANFGRSHGMKLVAGLQSFAQLKERYGEKAIPIAAGFSNCIAMRCVEEESREYISSRFGKTFENLTYAGQNIHRESWAVTDADQRDLSAGEAFIDLCDTPAFRFKFKEYHR